MEIKARIEALKQIGFIEHSRGWIEETSQIILSEENINSMSDEDFEEEIGFIEYVLSK